MSDVAVELKGVGKMYKIFSSRSAHLIDALAVPRLFPWSRPRYREFWALRGIDLELRRGERLGIIGRNGAGKSTLLRLITGNVTVTEGSLSVKGDVQALIEAGGGFHPEFTGRENIAAALLYQGHSPAELKREEEEIADFTELEAFLDQPFKTYSLGMQARLTFAVATAVRPEILIVDEMLGAGDAYFMNKCTERMQQLVSGGATVLLVSHSLEQVMLFCDHTVWLERGRIVGQGRSMEVCKAYEKYIRELDDKRLKAKNLKVRSATYASIQYENYSDTCVARFTVDGRPTASLDVSEIRLLKDGEPDDALLVGEAQDANQGQSAQVILEKSAWSAPTRDGDRRFRRLSPMRRQPGSGSAIFNLYALLPEARYEFEVTFRKPDSSHAVLELLSNGVIRNVVELNSSGQGEWHTVRHPLDKPASEPAPPEPLTQPSETSAPAAETRGVALSRWPGQGALIIEQVRLIGPEGANQTVYAAGDRLTVRMAFVAKTSGDYSVIPVAVLFRRDGVLVSRYIGDEMSLHVTAGDRREVELDLGPLKFGNGHYVFSMALYKSLDVDYHVEPEIYDLLDRSYEFEVYGTPALKTGIYLDQAQWRPIDS